MSQHTKWDKEQQQPRAAKQRAHAVDSASDTEGAALPMVSGIPQKKQVMRSTTIAVGKKRY